MSFGYRDEDWVDPDDCETEEEYVRDCKHNPNATCPLQKPKCDCCSIRWDWEREIRNEED